MQKCVYVCARACARISMHVHTASMLTNAGVSFVRRTQRQCCETCEARAFYSTDDLCRLRLLLALPLPLPWVHAGGRPSRGGWLGTPSSTLLVAAPSMHRCLPACRPTHPHLNDNVASTTAAATDWHPSLPCRCPHSI